MNDKKKQENKKPDASEGADKFAALDPIPEDSTPASIMASLSDIETHLELLTEEQQALKAQASNFVGHLAKLIAPKTKFLWRGEEVSIIQRRPKGKADAPPVWFLRRASQADLAVIDDE